MYLNIAQLAGAGYTVDIIEDGRGKPAAVQIRPKEPDFNFQRNAIEEFQRQFPAVQRDILAAIVFEALHKAVAQEIVVITANPVVVKEDGGPVY